MPLCNTARAAIEELGGLGVRDLSADEVATLNDLAEAVEKSGAELAGGVARDVPVSLAGIVLWPPTLAAEDWLARLGPAMADSGADWLAFFAYALAHGRDPDALDHADFASARKAVAKWMRRIPCTRGELERACDALVSTRDLTATGLARAAVDVLRGYFLRNRDAAGEAAVEAAWGRVRPEAEKAPSKPAAAFWRDFEARLCAICGGRPDEWAATFVADAMRIVGYAVELEAARSGAKKEERVPVEQIKALRAEVARLAGSGRRNAADAREAP